MKIFIIYANAGAGHKKAAEALFKVAELRLQKPEVEIFDALDYTNSFFKWAYSATYLFSVNYLPYLWGFFYYLFDFKPVYSLVSPLRSMFNFLNSRKLRDKLINEKPDVVISTHFLPSCVTANLISRGLLETKLLTVMTDFLPHYVWINPGTNFYSVAVPIAKQRLISRGVSEEKIKIFGIPINPLFLQEEEKSVLRKKLGFAQDKFIALLVSGGFGVGPVEEMLRILDKSVLDLEIVVVCGNNPHLYRKLKKRNFRKKMHLFAFVNNMHQLMKASDVIITKAGGLSVSEALACNLPILVVPPVPGQEGRNCYVLTQNKVAVRLGSIRALGRIMIDFIEDKARVVQMENIKSLAHPMATFDIIEFAMRLCHNSAFEKNAQPGFKK